MSRGEPSTPGAPNALPDDRRLVRLVHETVERLSLDLRGLAILTEAATGAFSVTPTIAAVAGADRVFAVARDSDFGSAADAGRESRRVARACGAEQSVHVLPALDAATVGASDVITNLGFVRPLDARVVAWMKPTAVVTLMCEAWEFRPGDVDVEACRAQGIVVLATNEHTSSFPVFAYCGPLAVQMLTDAGVELHGARVAVLGLNAFTPVIVDALVRAGAVVRADGRAPTAEGAEVAEGVADRAQSSLFGTPASAIETIDGADVILVAEYASTDIILGDGGILSAEDVARVAPNATVVQFAGALEPASLGQRGIRVWPLPPVGARRMSRTLAYLGVRPVIELHAAGLKVGELGARARLAGLSPDAAIEDACRRSELVQPLLPQP